MRWRSPIYVELEYPRVGLLIANHTTSMNTMTGEYEPSEVRADGQGRTEGWQTS